MKKTTTVVVTILWMLSFPCLATTVWTGNAGDDRWSNSGNWSAGVPTSSENASISGVNEPNAVTITTADYAVAQHVILGQTTNAGDAVLVIEDGVLELTYDIQVGYYQGNRGILNIEGGILQGRDIQVCYNDQLTGISSLEGIVNMTGGTIGAATIYLPYHVKGRATMTMTAGTVNAYNLYISADAGTGGNGYMHLNGGTVNVSNSFLVSDSRGHLNITKGVLIVNGDITSTINFYVSAGRITAYNGATNVICELIEGGTKTKITAEQLDWSFNPNPENNSSSVYKYQTFNWSTGQTQDIELSWAAGKNAFSHDVYFGVDYNDVNSAARENDPCNVLVSQNQTAESYTVAVDWNKTYYWRIDDVNQSGQIHKGDVWKFKTIQSEWSLPGGNVSLQKIGTVITSRKHLNFAITSSFDNGVVWLCYTEGIHTATEQTKYLWSMDYGETWSVPDIFIRPPVMVQMPPPDGNIISFSCHSPALTQNHTVNKYVWSTPTTRAPGSFDDFQMPWLTTILTMRRSLVVTGAGNFVAPAQCQKDGEDLDLKHRVVCLGSDPTGENWSYLSTIAANPKATTRNAYAEPSMVKLEDGTLLCLIRTGPDTPGVQSFSYDDGYTWTAPVNIPGNNACVDPIITLLSNGALVAAMGVRPGMDIYVDFSGTGQNWQKIPTQLFKTPNTNYYDEDGFGCGYTGLVEIEPGVVMLTVPESDFTQAPSMYPYFQGTNRLMNAYFRVDPYTADIDNSGVVDFSDYSILSNNWLDDCNAPGWCSGADIIDYGIVDSLDLERFVQHWLDDANE